MLVRTLDDLAPGKGEIRTPSWSSRRLLHRDDGMGVTLTDAVLEAGLDQVWWYKNHLETVYCLEGEGVLEDLGAGKFYEIKPGTLYALDKHERHRLKVKRRMRVICTFVPPLVGARYTTRKAPMMLDETCATGSVACLPSAGVDPMEN
ncbi:MAG TPA: ectoine synthase [Terriglobales bacterium]|nr:ectoine synthase [Terriglobales bacterium]